METGTSANDGAVPFAARVKAILRLGSEIFSIDADGGVLLSEQLSSVKERCMSTLNEFIAKNNAPNDVPDEPIEGSASDEEEGTTAAFDNPTKKSKT